MDRHFGERRIVQRSAHAGSGTNYALRRASSGWRGASQNPSKPCSEMLRGLEIVKTNDIAQASDRTIQVQAYSPLLNTQLHFAL